MNHMTNQSHYLCPRGSAIRGEYCQDLIFSYMTTFHSFSISHYFVFISFLCIPFLIFDFILVLTSLCFPFLLPFWLLLLTHSFHTSVIINQWSNPCTIIMTVHCPSHYDLYFLLFCSFLFEVLLVSTRQYWWCAFNAIDGMIALAIR